MEKIIFSCILGIIGLVALAGGIIVSIEFAQNWSKKEVDKIFWALLYFCIAGGCGFLISLCYKSYQILCYENLVVLRKRLSSNKSYHIPYERIVYIHGDNIKKGRSVKILAAIDGKIEVFRIKKACFKKKEDFAAFKKVLASKEIPAQEGLWA